MTNPLFLLFLPRPYLKANPFPLNPSLGPDHYVEEQGQIGRGKGQGSREEQREEDEEGVQTFDRDSPGSRVGHDLGFDPLADLAVQLPGGCGGRRVVHERW